MDCSLPGSSVHGILCASTGMCCCALLQGIVLTQVLKPYLVQLLYCMQILYRWANKEAFSQDKFI